MFPHDSQLGGSGSHTNSKRPRGRRGEAKQSEHCGPKRGNGSYGGYKWEAKKESNRIRRENAKREVRGATADAVHEESTGSPPATKNGG